MQKIKTILLITTLVLSACDGDDSNNGSDPDSNGIYDSVLVPSPTVGSAGILANIQETNLPAWGGSTQQHLHYNLKRWDYETTLIPVKHKNVPLVIQAMDEIERRLGFIIFDRDSLANIDDDDIIRGIIVSIGTANYLNFNGLPAFDLGVCGLASRGVPSIENSENVFFPYYMYDTNGKIDTKIYIHLGSPFNVDCYKSGLTSTTTLHEFGHVLGFKYHFEGGFNGRKRHTQLEDGTEIYYAEKVNDNFFNVLKNIYSNAINTAKDDLIITQYF
ncbi:hypothetical protein [uncultured Gammaproteobacteria bacterium]|jgi:hypothetical protein|nr:hypothetical protein [uncultured Gammaproteobacteria bacterium]